MFLKKLSKKEKIKQRESRNEFHLIIKRYRAIGNQIRDFTEDSF